MKREPLDSKENGVVTMYDACLTPSWGEVLFAVDIVILVTGVLANAALLVLFLRARKTLSASQVLGMNLVIMNLMYLTIIPVDLMSRPLLFSTSNTTRARPDVSTIISGNQTDTSRPKDLRKIFNTFILFGTPLLLTCMCVERHLAVSQPVLYMKLRDRKYRMMVSAVVWVMTLGFSVTSQFIGTIQILIPVSVMISFLFLVMLLSLGTMVWSLWQMSPAHDTVGNKARPNSPQKRQAVQSLLIVVVSTILVYLPLLVLSPFILYVQNNRELSLSTEAVCNVFQCSLLFPRFGVLIGPLFFFSKAKQMFKFKKRSNSA